MYNLSVIAYAMPPLLVGEALAIHKKQNLFVKGSPTRKDSLRPEGDVA